MTLITLLGLFELKIGVHEQRDVTTSPNRIELNSYTNYCPRPGEKYGADNRRDG